MFSFLISCFPFPFSLTWRDAPPCASSLDFRTCFPTTVLGLSDVMERLAPECRPKKEDYDKCTKSWYKENLLKGNFGGMEDKCGPLFLQWRCCVEDAVERWKESQSTSAQR